LIQRELFLPRRSRGIAWVSLSILLRGGQLRLGTGDDKIEAVASLDNGHAAAAVQNSTRDVMWDD
jgi:hypothetical protein